MAMRLLTFLPFLLVIAWLPVSLTVAMSEQGAVAAGVSAARPWLILVSALASIRSGRLVKIASGLGLTMMTTINTVDLGAGRLGRTILLSCLLRASLEGFAHTRPSGHARGDRHVH